MSTFRLVSNLPPLSVRVPMLEVADRFHLKPLGVRRADIPGKKTLRRSCAIRFDAAGGWQATCLR